MYARFKPQRVSNHCVLIADADGSVSRKPRRIGFTQRGAPSSSHSALLAAGGDTLLHERDKQNGGAVAAVT